MPSAARATGLVWVDPRWYNSGTMNGVPGPGDRLAGYVIGGVIGRGGMGIVYEAEHVALGRSVALKIVAPELATDLTFRERFLREARLAAALEHPAIIPIHDAGEVDGIVYIAMRRVHGSDLGASLATSGPMPSRRAVGVLGPVAGALDAAHRRLHRGGGGARDRLARAEPNGE